MYLFDLLAFLLLSSSSLCAEARLKNNFKSPQDRARITYYTLPTSDAGPCDMDTGPDGASIWYQVVTGSGNSRIGFVNITTGKVHDFHAPYSPATYSTAPFVVNSTLATCTLRLGRNGDIYAASASHFEIIQVETVEKILRARRPKEYCGTRCYDTFNNAASGPKGMLFSQFESDALQEYNYKTHSFPDRRYGILHPPDPYTGPFGMYFASDGSFWFTGLVAQKLFLFNDSSLRYTQYILSQAGAVYPGVIRAETGNYLWITACGSAGGLIRFDKTLKTHKIFRYPHANSYPQYSAKDNDGNIWFSSAQLNILAYLTPSTGEWTTIQLSGTVQNANRRVMALTLGPDNAMWFTNLATKQIGRYQLD